MILNRTTKSVQPGATAKFRVDGGPFVSQADKNITWTIIVLSMRRQYIVEQMKNKTYNLTLMDRRKSIKTLVIGGFTLALWRSLQIAREYPRCAIRER
jgi:hypothetical protein